MKICQKCGSYNSDDRQFCVDCAAFLGKSLSPEEEKAVKRQIQQQMDKLHDETDPLYVDRFDKVVGIASLACMGLLLICLVLLLVQGLEAGLVFPAFLFLLVSVLSALAPNLGWSLDKLRLSFTIEDPDSASPSAFYRFGRKVGETAGLLVGAVILGVSLFGALKPLAAPPVPVVEYIEQIAGNKEAALHSDIRAYIDASPELWEKILDCGEEGVDEMVEEIEQAPEGGLREALMMQAVTEITGIGEGMYFDSKEDWLMEYYRASSTGRMTAETWISH